MHPLIEEKARKMPQVVWHTAAFIRDNPGCTPKRVAAHLNATLFGGLISPSWGWLFQGSRQSSLHSLWTSLPGRPRKLEILPAGIALVSRPCPVVESRVHPNDWAAAVVPGDLLIVRGKKGSAVTLWGMPGGGGGMRSYHTTGGDPLIVKEVSFSYSERGIANWGHPTIEGNVTGYMSNGELITLPITNLRLARG